MSAWGVTVVSWDGGVSVWGGDFCEAVVGAVSEPEAISPPGVRERLVGCWALQELLTAW